MKGGKQKFLMLLTNISYLEKLNFCTKFRAAFSSENLTVQWSIHGKTLSTLIMKKIILKNRYFRVKYMLISFGYGIY